MSKKKKNPLPSPDIDRVNSHQKGFDEARKLYRESINDGNGDETSSEKSTYYICGAMKYFTMVLLNGRHLEGMGSGPEWVKSVLNDCYKSSLEEVKKQYVKYLNGIIEE